MRSFLRVVLYGVTSLSVGATIVAFVWPLFFPVDVGLMILAALAIAGGHFVLLWLVRESPPAMDDRVSLQRGTVEFADYYRRFYELEGYLSIFCEDTEWLEGDVMKPVVEAIGSKAGRATLFLSVQGVGEEIAKELKNRGVKIVNVPANLALEVKMSFRVDGTARDLMIRGAGDGTGPVPPSVLAAKEINTFTRTQNPDMVNLAQAILSAIAPEDKEFAEKVDVKK